MKHLGPALAVLLVAFTGEAQSETTAERVNCERYRYIKIPSPEPGPLRLKSVFCQSYKSGLNSAPKLSPDGISIAYYAGRDVLKVARLREPNSWKDYSAPLGVFGQFSIHPLFEARAFEWRSDSRGLWTATGAKATPAGFATAPLRPAETLEDGALRQLPAVAADGEPLDGLLWAGADGLALAQFGTRGGFDRPEHDDQNPTFGIVDAPRGVLLDKFSLLSLLPEERLSPSSYYVRIRSAAAINRPDGRVQAFLDLGQHWVSWLQGEAPRALPSPYYKPPNTWPRPLDNTMVLSPDGKSVLLGMRLKTTNVRCGRIGDCTRGTPSHGSLATLHDVESGRALWSVEATVTNSEEFASPAISPDGALALVQLPSPEDRKTSRIALVSAADGSIRQVVESAPTVEAQGFTNGGRTVWTSGRGVTVFFELALGSH